jgi:hypothetical protein
MTRAWSDGSSFLLIFVGLPLGYRFSPVRDSGAAAAVGGGGYALGSCCAIRALTERGCGTRVRCLAGWV